jgi:membrane protein YdbS with pleckstrin-like domain
MTQTATDPTPAPDNRPHRPADDTEEVYFEGSPLLKAELGKVILWGIAGIMLLALVITNLVKWHWGLPWWLSLGLGLLAIVLMFVPALLRKSLRYRITNYRIDITSGVVSRNIATVELWHVEDIKLHQSLLNRIAGVGTITLTAHDQAMPQFELRGLPQPQQLFTMLEQRVIAVKRQRGVMKVDPG